MLYSGLQMGGVWECLFQFKNKVINYLCSSVLTGVGDNLWLWTCIVLRIIEHN